MIRFFTLIFLTLLSGCATVNVNGEARVRLFTVGEILKNCPALSGKEVVVEGTYRGWSCPADCRNPGVTRSDVCITDSTGCIYLSGTSGLDPLTDRGKRVRVLALVSRKGSICYLKPEKVDELR